MGHPKSSTGNSLKWTKMKHMPYMHMAKTVKILKVSAATETSFKRLCVCVCVGGGGGRVKFYGL